VVGVEVHDRRNGHVRHLQVSRRFAISSASAWARDSRNQV
jgi:hypothetical protein